MRVIVRKASSACSWYSNRIGEIFEVMGLTSGFYPLKSDYGSKVERHILASDCEVIREEGVIGVDSEAERLAEERYPTPMEGDLAYLYKQQGFIAGYEKGREYHDEMLEMLKRAHVYLGEKERLALITKIETNAAKP